MKKAKHDPVQAASMTVFDFHGDKLDVAHADGRLNVAIRRVTDALGIDFSSQLQRLKADPVMGVVMIATPSAGGVQMVACVDIRVLPLWLAKIHPSKVSEAARQKLIRFQREAAEVLADHFLGKRGVVPAGYLSPDQHVAQLEPHVRRVAELEEDRRFLREANEALRQSVRSTICADELDTMLRLERSIAELWIALGKAKTGRGAIARVRHRSMPGCYAKGARMKHLQRELVPKVLRELEVMLADARDEAKRAGIIPSKRRRVPSDTAASTQGVLDFERSRRAAGAPANTNQKRSA